MTIFWFIIDTSAAQIKTISPKGHQAIKAKIINGDPAHFAIHVKSLANFGANEDAPSFAVYLTPRLPERCGNFLHLYLHYNKPKKYHRVFDLSKHKEVLDAINIYKCVVIRNMPSE